MIDLILRNARIAGHDELSDLGVADGVIVTVGDGETARETIDLSGGWSPRRWSSRTSTWTRC